MNGLTVVKAANKLGDYPYISSLGGRGLGEPVKRRFGFLPLAFVMLLVFCANAGASELGRFLSPENLARVYPGADNAGETGGQPPSAPVFRDSKLIGYAYLTSDVINSTGYSGKPVKILVGFDLAGIITGAMVVEHQEPILVLGIPNSSLDTFINQFKGKDLRRRVRVGAPAAAGESAIDMVSGASITSLVFSDSVMRAGRMVARTYGVIGPGEQLNKGDIDLESFTVADWPTLLKDGYLRRLRLSKGGVAAAFSRQEGEEDKDKLFIDLVAGLITPPVIGQNLFGFASYNKIMAGLGPDASAIMVAGRGYYSFRGYNYRRSGYFERLQLVQGDKTIRLTKEMHQTAPKFMIAKAPDFREVSLFKLSPESGFDPVRPWRLELLVEEDTASGGQRFAGFPLNYVIPEKLLKAAIASSVGQKQASIDRPLWQQQWLGNIPQIAILITALIILTGLMVFEDRVTRRGRSVDLFRRIFLLFTLVYLGWIASAQLSVINVLTFIHALMSNFSWGFFLLEPLIFILWGFVALVLLFWGRGVFCGWLCPFGALQELLNRIAMRFKLPQFQLPFAVNERLWAIKYIVFLGLLALSLGPVGMAEKMTEVEPFKTAISLKFIRAWPFVVYALGILTASLFLNRIFCRYLCPLGAALAIPANNRMFDWLKRHHQCGVECQVCAIRCPVQAIHPDGHIDLHECIYCLDCQSVYHDDKLCPPMVDKRKRRERRQAMVRGESMRRKAVK